jgi:distribution and morphology protein 34
LEISELHPDRFKGIFKLVYTGNAYLMLSTFVQANPLFVQKPKPVLSSGPQMLLADKPLVVPMEMCISDVQLRGIIVLVVDKEKGITLVFKNDPLESVKVSSTFDNIPNIRALLQRQIEKQLRNMFQEELPQMIHNLSKLQLQKEQGVTLERRRSLGRIVFSIHKDSRLSHGGYVPHHKKWSGNEMLEDDTGYVLYRSLSMDQFDHGDGLHKIIEPRRVTRQQRIDRLQGVSDRNSERIPEGEERLQLERMQYVPVGMPQRSPTDRFFDPRFQPDYVTRVQAFLDNTSQFQPLQGFEDDELQSVSSAWTAPVYIDPYPVQSPPASVHKSQVSEVWHRPSVSSRPATRTPLDTPPMKSKSSLPTETQKQRVILRPSDNEITAHLANLMKSHLTISPNTQNLAHVKVRAEVRAEMSDSRSLPDRFGSTRRLRVVRKRHRHTIKVPRGFSDTLSVFSGDA